MMLARRTHLYVGLFLIPWALLYGVTGAMFNHSELFPRVQPIRVNAAAVAESPMRDFPSADALARSVVALVDAATEDVVALADNPHAEFTNNLMFEVQAEGQKHVVHLDPTTRTAFIHAHPKDDGKPARLLPGVNGIRLEDDPFVVARASVQPVMTAAGVKPSSSPRPVGWSKLNFIATVNDEPARITYVLKDGHVDTVAYTGEAGMPTRQFFLRLHTSHGRSPHWNGRTVWSLFVDAMAIAMVVWSLTGLLMWWQIKRTRWLGAVTIALSVATAAGAYYGMAHFYATTML